MTSDVVIVGAGLAGVACARELRGAGLDVRVLDRGHRVGGRMASRRLWDRATDLGASYLTASDPAFTQVVGDWAARGLAAPWTDTFTVLEGDGSSRTSSGPMRWGAPGGLRSLVEDLASGLDVEQVEQADLDLAASAIVLAMPDPQARRLVGDHPVTELLGREWEPVIALAARWDRRTWDAISPTGRFDGAFVNGDPALGWVADDGRRRGDEAPVLVVHSTPELAARHLAEPAGAAPELIAAVRRLMDLGEPADAHVHRWTFARPVGEREASYALVDGDRESGLVGVCGDGWGPKPKVETAWLSGMRLGRELADRLSAGASPSA